MRKPSRLRFCFLACLLTGSPAWGQAGAAVERPSIRAERLGAEDTIRVDGRLDEEAWVRAAPAADFRQADPRNGAPASERSEVRIVFNADHLYIGAELFDGDPDGLLGNQMVRDGALDADDRFMLTLDPENRQRNGYFFEVNPAGALGDAQLVPSQSQTEVGTTQNRSWDGIWNARVRRHERGWTVEIDIPFRTVNFDPAAEAWGVNFQRTVRRKNEESYWTAWGRNQGLLNLVYQGRIDGITGIGQGHGIDIKPYALGTFTDNRRLGAEPSSLGNELGVDVAYSVTPRLRMQLTVNTDFAQTEVDDRQINLSRVALFFPEKRDFFLEGSGQFDFGRERPNILTPFFSRRIGLSEAGQPQPIDYGFKITGQAAGIDLGVVQVRTAADDGIAGEDFTVVRPRKTFLSQSYVGVIYTRRVTRDSVAADRHTIGADIQIATSRFRGSQNLQFGAYVLKTPTATVPGDDAAWGVRIDYPNDRWIINTNFKEFQKNFFPAVGFVERTDYRKVFNLVQFRPRPQNNRWIRQITTGFRSEFFLEFDGTLSDRIFNITPLQVNFQSGDTFAVLVTPSYERLDRPFRVGPSIALPSGAEYRYTRYNLTAATASRRTVSGDLNLTVGSFYSGERRDLGGSLTVRPRRGLLATLSATFSDIDMPEGVLSTKILRGIVSTQFSPRVSVSNNVQFDSASRMLGWQSRFRWIAAPGNDLYVVWQHNWLDGASRFSTLDRQLAAKLVYTYRV